MDEILEKIIERNKRVEKDKAWEVSKTRRFIISLLTYLVVVIFLKLIKAPHPYLNALIPCAGFLLSTITLPFVKKIWLKKIER